MKSDNPNPYADIIDLPHHVSKRHPQMPMEKRAAQFSPFAAMVGHDAAIRETARLTEEQRNNWNCPRMKRLLLTANCK